MKKRVFSGVQPTGDLHIGNYLGALKNFVAIQHEYDCIFCVVDLHAITVFQDPVKLRAKVEEIAAIFLAAGIDPKSAAIMAQSDVSGHAELGWMLTCVTPTGWLYRMTQFKSKSEAQDMVLSGLLMYPVLMAADILLYNAHVVPVGEDQAQHLELTRDIAQRFNSLYGETFVVPETKLPSAGARVMGLDDPAKKMSKSETGAGHAIGLLDPPDLIRKKLNRATTDSNPAVDLQTMGPGVANLLDIYRAFDGTITADLEAKFSGMRYGDLKRTVAEMVIAHLEPFQKRYSEIVAEKGYVAQVLQAGADRVRPWSEETLALVRGRMGLK
jgi:tryptophanyl-tRNA synthetase